MHNSRRTRDGQIPAVPFCLISIDNFGLILFRQIQSTFFFPAAEHGWTPQFVHGSLVMENSVFSTPMKSTFEFVRNGQSQTGRYSCRPDEQAAPVHATIEITTPLRKVPTIFAYTNPEQTQITHALFNCQSIRSLGGSSVDRIRFPR